MWPHQYFAIEKLFVSVYICVPARAFFYFSLLNVMAPAKLLSRRLVYYIQLQVQCIVVFVICLKSNLRHKYVHVHTLVLKYLL